MEKLCKNADSSHIVTPDCESVNPLPQNLSNTVSEESNGAIGHNVNGSVSAQHNTVSDNHGITGITGTGHTINIYHYPKELTELLMKLAK